MDSKELKGLVEAYSEVYAPQEVDEAVKGASPHAMQMRKDAASERKAGAKDRLSPSEGKANAAKMQRDIKFYDKITKKTKPSVVGMTHEEVEQVDELYKGKHGQSETEYQDSRSNAGKMVSGTSKLSGAAYSSRGVKNTGPNPAGGSQKPQAQGRMTSGQRTELQYRKANLMKKEELDIFDTILEYLVAEGYADNNREALHIMANSSEEQILEYRKLAAAAVGGLMALNMMKPGMPAPKVKTSTPEREKTELVSKAKTGKEDKESKQYIQNRLERDRELGISK